MYQAEEDINKATCTGAGEGWEWTEKKGKMDFDPLRVGGKIAFQR